MGGPIVRSGATPEFSKNWDSVFGGKKAKKSVAKKKTTKAKADDAAGSEPAASEAEAAPPADESAGTIETAKPKRGWWQRTFGD